MILKLRRKNLHVNENAGAKSNSGMASSIRTPVESLYNLKRQRVFAERGTSRVLRGRYKKTDDRFFSTCSIGSRCIRLSALFSRYILTNGYKNVMLFEQARDLRILLVFYQHPAWFISL